MEIEEIKENLTDTEQVPDIVKLEENDNQPQVQVQPKNKKIKISAFKCNSCGKKFSILKDLGLHIQLYGSTCSSLGTVSEDNLDKSGRLSQIGINHDRENSEETCVKLEEIEETENELAVENDPSGHENMLKRVPHPSSYNMNNKKKM